MSGGCRPNDPGCSGDYEGYGSITCPGMVTKTQSNNDRRVFEVELTSEASRLLKKIDQPILDLHASLLSNVAKSDLTALIRLLNQSALACLSKD